MIDTLQWLEENLHCLGKPDPTSNIKQLPPMAKSDLYAEMVNKFEIDGKKTCFFILFQKNLGETFS